MPVREAGVETSAYGRSLEQLKAYPRWCSELVEFGGSAPGPQVLLADKLHGWHLELHCNLEHSIDGDLIYQLTKRGMRMELVAVGADLSRLLQCHLELVPYSFAPNSLILQTS